MLRVTRERQLNEFHHQVEEINYKSIRTMEIEGLTGLRGIIGAFENNDGMTEVESLVTFLNKTYELSDDDYDILNYLIGTIKFSETFLQNIGANYEEFYYNMTTNEAIEIILNKILNHSDNMEKKNGFPKEFNFNTSMTNRTQVYNGKRWFPYVPSLFVRDEQNLNLDGNSKASMGTDPNYLNNRFLEGIDTENNYIFYHGTSWLGASLIMDEIEIRPRMNATDFGLRNFYVTDMLITAMDWANRNAQPAICIFAVPRDYLDNLENHLKLYDDYEWKRIVYTARNYPKPPYVNPNSRRNYRQFIANLDSKNLISGPIMAYAGAHTIEDVRSIKYGNETSLQYSFKDTTIGDLNDMLAVTVFFQRNG